MAYVGNTPADKTLKLEKQQFTTSATTSYTLSHSVSDPQDIALFINNVRQNPNSSYTVSGTALTLSAATASTDTMYCVFLGRAIGAVGIGAGSVTKDKVDFISDSSGSGVISKGDGSSIDGSIQLNCHVNSHGIKLKSPPHSAGQSYTLTFPSTAPSAGKVLQTDGSGNLSFGGNTPAFEAYPSASLSVASGTSVKVQANTERFDTDSAYDNSSNYRFTPQVSGRYFTYCSFTYNLANGSIGLVAEIRKNGSAVLSSKHEDAAGSNYLTGYVGGVVQLNGSSDYLEMFTLTSSGSTRTLAADSQRTFFGAYRIIGA